ncbi:hypothetical protein NQ314_005840 [Rhamnusium bicolor]|uniref:Anoctamin n=1 Tax=Rhamnusium bicolor TaxID=1586634 RepID=A0AAV8ZED2_9CUCU|nr:hypothetical protein NQ314_005840 [Rhamnusium bicolor]
MEKKIDIPKHGCFFKDGERRADYVIVIKGELLSPLVTYIRALEFLGLELELVLGQTVERIFLLIHIPQSVLKHFAKFYNVDHEEKNFNLPKRKKLKHLSLYSTPISDIAAEEKGTYTSADRIIIVNNLLEYAKYGDKLNEKGITKLIKIKWIEAAYPLHDGPEEIGNYNIVYANDRQLLFFYWSNFRVWYKELPLDMIHKYFGSEIAFYFAWLEFFNLMLLPAAILGFLVFVVNLIIVMVFPIYRIKETCNVNNMWICPTCELQKHCAYNQLSSYCTYVKWCYVFDNYLTIAFAVFMSLWATIFINLWRRKQNKLQLRWDVVHAEMEGSAR